MTIETFISDLTLYKSNLCINITLRTAIDLRWRKKYGNPKAVF